MCMMSEGSRDEQAPRLLKRANEENEEAAELQDTKRIKAEGEHTEDEKKYPKKKVVLLLAYSGKGYYGMQVHAVAGFPPLSLPKHLIFFYVLLNLNVFCVFFFRETPERLSSGPLKMISSPRLLNRVASLKTMATT